MKEMDPKKVRKNTNCWSGVGLNVTSQKPHIKCSLHYDLTHPGSVKRQLFFRCHYVTLRDSSLPKMHSRSSKFFFGTHRG